MNQYRFRQIFCVSLIFCAIASTGLAQPAVKPAPDTMLKADPFKGHSHFLAGRVDEARASNQALLRYAREDKGSEYLWQSLMYVAWIEHMFGNYSGAVQYSTEALEIAKTQLKQPYYIGRSLCWLGWAFNHLGYYELAIEFFQKAAELGMKDGQVTIPATWGLGTQEIGAIHAKMGNLDEAAKLLVETISYARAWGIDVGISEGGSALAGVYLMQGKLDAAEQIANDAIAAAQRTPCSPYNTARSLVALAKVSLARTKLASGHEEEARLRAAKAVTYSRERSDDYNLSAALMIQSQLLSETDLPKRLELAREALKLSEKGKSDLRGTATGELGSIHKELAEGTLAEKYLRLGIEIEQSLFRRLHASNVKEELAHLKGITGDKRSELEELEEAATSARESGANLLALRKEERLAEELFRLGYYTLAQQWSYAALETLANLKELNSDDSDLDKREYVITSRLTEIHERLAGIAPAFKMASPN